MRWDGLGLCVSIASFMAASWFGPPAGPCFPQKMLVDVLWFALGTEKPAGKPEGLDPALRWLGPG